MSKNKIKREYKEPDMRKLSDNFYLLIKYSIQFQNLTSMLLYLVIIVNLDFMRNHVQNIYYLILIQKMVKNYLYEACVL